MSTHIYRGHATTTPMPSGMGAHGAPGASHDPHADSEPPSSEQTQFGQASGEPMLVTHAPFAPSAVRHGWQHHAVEPASAAGGSASVPSVWEPPPQAVASANVIAASSVMLFMPVGRRGVGLYSLGEA